MVINDERSSMVARIKFGKSVSGALNYNERKVEKGAAECIGANGFLKEIDEMNFYEKLEVFTNRNDLNTATITNTIHISLNFDPSEKLNKEVLNCIASSYMDRLGFADQPYLVYDHHDAAHPHMHIVSTIIEANGNRIPTHFIGKEKSEKSRKEVEEEFALVKANDKRKVKDISEGKSLEPAEPQKVNYGKNEIKKSIAWIVSNVTRTYRFTSLAELNAVLHLYNVNANRGGEHSQMFLKGGLQYTVINDKGERVGIPVKASSLPGQPTLKTLEKKFKVNEALRPPLRDPLRRIIQAALSMNSVKSSEDLGRVLELQNIRTLWRINPQGRAYGITFVDQGRKAVFNGSDLGKAYTANAILGYLSAKENAVDEKRHPRKEGVGFNLDEQKHEERDERSQLAYIVDRLAFVHSNEDLTSPENALRLKKRKRKKKPS